jgi:hypothetical protein
VTRWLAVNNKVVAEYQVAINDVNKECESIVQIPTTPLVMVMYNGTNKIILLDTLGMSLVREIVHPTIIYEESKCDIATFWSGFHRMVCL